MPGALFRRRLDREAGTTLSGRIKGKVIEQSASSSSAMALLQEGYSALRAGDPRRARTALDRVVQMAPRDLNGLYGLAVACLALKDQPAKLAALDQLLAVDPGNMRALIMKGDHYADLGDDRAASAFYGEALAVAPPDLPPDLMREAQRAHAMQQRYAAAFEQRLRTALEAEGVDQASGRFLRSVDILTGRRRPYMQEPRTFLFAELPQIQFYEREQFPWMGDLEAATGEIRDELRAVMADSANFAPYVEGEKDRPGGDYHGMLGNADWSSFYLWKDGAPVEANAARCPRTMQALDKAPLSLTPGRTPSVLFSMLKPGARIPPHTGMVNTRLICHLPLIVPPGCGLRVGNDTREWAEGKAWAFDDTIEHEAWNNSGQTRVILLFDIWRPELTEDERRLVNAMFAAIDSEGGARSWGT